MTNNYEKQWSAWYSLKNWFKSLFESEGEERVIERLRLCFTLKRAAFCFVVKPVTYNSRKYPKPCFKSFVCFFYIKVYCSHFVPFLFRSIKHMLPNRFNWLIYFGPIGLFLHPCGMVVIGI